MIIVQFTHRQRSMMNEKQCQKFNANQEETISTKDILMTKIDFTNINLNQQSQEVRVSEKFHAFFEIFENVNTMRKVLQ